MSLSLIVINSLRCKFKRTIIELFYVLLNIITWLHAHAPRQLLFGFTSSLQQTELKIWLHWHCVHIVEIEWRLVFFFFFCKSFLHTSASRQDAEGAFSSHFLSSVSYCYTYIYNNTVQYTLSVWDNIKSSVYRSCKGLSLNKLWAEERHRSLQT